MNRYEMRYILKADQGTWRGRRVVASPSLRQARRALELQLRKENGENYLWSAFVSAKQIGTSKPEVTE